MPMYINMLERYLRSRLQCFYNTFGTDDAKLPERAVFVPHFPMQNLLKIFPKISSVEICPVISPR